MEGEGASRLLLGELAPSRWFGDGFIPTDPIEGGEVREKEAPGEDP